MMTRRRVFVIAGILVSVACIVLVTLAMLPPRPGVTKANFDRIEEGMNAATVKEILGKEPALTDGWESMRRSGTVMVWVGDDGGVSMVFYDDAATDIRWSGSTETITDKLYRWLHLN